MCIYKAQPSVVNKIMYVPLNPQLKAQKDICTSNARGTSGWSPCIFLPHSFSVSLPAALEWTWWLWTKAEAFLQRICNHLVNFYIRCFKMKSLSIMLSIKECHLGKLHSKERAFNCWMKNFVSEESLLSAGSQLLQLPKQMYSCRKGHHGVTEDRTLSV